MTLYGVRYTGGRLDDPVWPHTLRIYVIGVPESWTALEQPDSYTESVCGCTEMPLTIHVAV